jgi:hypothetical protein
MHAIARNLVVRGDAKIRQLDHTYPLTNSKREAAIRLFKAASARTSQNIANANYDIYRELCSIDQGDVRSSVVAPCLTQTHYC